MSYRVSRARVDAVMLETNAACLVRRSVVALSNTDAVAVAVACTDLTTLEGADSPERVRALCAQAMAPGPGFPSVAAVCVYPSLIGVAKAALRGSRVRVASVAGGFPSGHAPLGVKLAEIAAAKAEGADEIDFAIDRGALLAGDARAVSAEISAAREACGDSTLKVILEAAELGRYSLVRRAADLALEAGADFVKTSTGKGAGGATPALALLLAQALRERRRHTGRRAGLKLAGGIRTSDAAIGYLAIVADTLGEDWLVPERLRIEASGLLESLVGPRPVAYA